MVYRWPCRHCGFVAWGADRRVLGERIQSHVLDHHRDSFSSDDFRVSWDCPYCDRAHQTHDEETSVREFAEHLFSHVEPLVAEGTHVAEEVDGSGDILVLSPPESEGANNARIHFTSAADIAVIVTTNPAVRLQMLRDRLDELPAWTVLVTTDRTPLEQLSELDLSSLPVEVVALDSSLGLSSLGETLSRVISEHESADGKMIMEFNILSEILSTFSLQQVFKFLHLLSVRLEDANALSHYYLSPSESDSTVNMIQELFDLTIRTSETIFATVE